MEENVALDSKKQKKFVKSIRGIKKLIKKNEGKPEPQKKDEKVEPQKPFSMRLNNGKIKKKKLKERGLVYLSHIPHGFYEHQMTQYFKQFGVVTNARVIKSKRTGNSKGFAFVEFKEPAVGQIVAETMNNYLMGKRLIKAAYIPPEKQKHKAFRKHWNSVNNPGSQARLKLKKAFNTDKDEAGDLNKAKKLLSNLTKTKKKLSELGISYDFFTPVDVPEVLQNQLIKQEKEDVDNDVKKESSQVKKIVKKGKPSQTDYKAIVKNKEKPTQVDNVKAPKANKNNKLVVVNAKQQKEKNRTLKKAGVKPAEFIKIEDDDSDSSYAFDSDEYEKMLQDEINYDLSVDESDTYDDDDDTVDPNESKEESPVKASKETPALKKVTPVQTKQQAQKQEPPKLQVMQQKKQKPQAKRKGNQKPAVTSKKPKFEKQNQKPIKKSFKKK